MDDREVLSKLMAPLKGWSVRVVGLGGIGTHVSQAMAQLLAYGAPDTPLYLIDGDKYEEKNRARMLFETAANKAIVRSCELSAALNGTPPIIPVPRYLTSRNARRLIEERNVVLLCVDNHSTRKIVSDSATRRRMRDVIVISGGNDGVEHGLPGTYGNVMVYLRRKGSAITNPFTRFHPEIANPRDKHPGQVGCAVQAVSAPQLLLTNLAVASGMLIVLYAWLKGELHYEELYLDLASATMRPVPRSRQLAGAATSTRTTG